MLDTVEKWHKETYICFQHTKGHENVIASPKGVAIPPRLLHFVRNDKRRTITKKYFQRKRLHRFPGNINMMVS